MHHRRTRVRIRQVALGGTIIALPIYVQMVLEYNAMEAGLSLAPLSLSEERASEAAGVNSAGGSFGLSFGLAFAGAIMLATLSIAFTNMAEASDVLPPAEQQRVAEVLEDDAQVMSNTQLEELLADQPEEIRAEIVRINTDARPLALQIALLVPILAGLAGLLNSFRMTRLPDPKPAGGGEAIALG